MSDMADIPDDVMEQMRAAAAERIAQVDEQLDAVLVDVGTGGGLIVRPGDVLLLSANAGKTVGQVMQLRGEILHELPGLRDVLILGGVTLAGVYRPDPQ